ncbi:hypothetical protein EK21DRAFT_113315 [Setomelanomma holmii]|uniref:Uncharacterized protein n=1 Tax=Setomelanomma holmii TaxID=210430 RepID=A0A9P4H7I8_9PLEO|nr:hypothetical protein EK21DRAFT_113315 [Setomelanomma holmii]
MPRNGDGSNDNGPIEGHEILHGASGDKALQHTKHVAPMPAQEEGDALPGMNAGGVAAPVTDASEEFGVNAPKHERLGDDEDLSGEKTFASTSSKAKSSGSTSSHNQQGSAGRQQHDSKSSGNSKSSNASQHDTASSTLYNDRKAHHDGEDNDFEQVEREKAEQFVDLNEEDVQHASSDNKGANGSERSSQRAPRDVGSKADVEQLHGQASSGPSFGKSGQTSGGQHGSHDSEKQGAKRDHTEVENLDSMRHTAEKFVKLDE